MRKENDSFEDVCALIGYTATTILISWAGGSNLFVPEKATEDHYLAWLIGMPSFRALCSEYASTTIWVPANPINSRIAVKRRIAKMIQGGHGSRAIMQEIPIGERALQRIRRELEMAGVLPMVLGSKNERAGTPTPPPLFQK